MFLNEKYKINILNFINFIKKNSLIILFITLIYLILGIFYINKNYTYSAKAEFILNLETFHEVKLPIIYIFESQEFNDYLDKNLPESFVINSNNSTEEVSIKDNIKYFPSLKGNDPYISIIYTNKSKDLTETFTENFLKLSNEFFTNKKNTILDNQIKNLQDEYNNLKKEITNLEVSNDPQLTSLISKLSYWKTLRNQSSPMITLIQSDVYQTLNKKLILIFSILMGLLFGIFVSLIKETIQELKKI